MGDPGHSTAAPQQQQHPPPSTPSSTLASCTLHRRRRLPAALLHPASAVATAALTSPIPPPSLPSSPLAPKHPSTQAAKPPTTQPPCTCTHPPCTCPRHTAASHLYTIIFAYNTTTRALKRNIHSCANVQSHTIYHRRYSFFFYDRNIFSVFNLQLKCSAAKFALKCIRRNVA